MRERLDHRSDARLEVTSRPGDAEEIAADATASGHDRIVAVGGDGTVQEVLNGILAAGASEPPALGILPLGSGNDLARSLDLPPDTESAWKVAIGRGERAIDVLRATNGSGGRWFASAGGIGFDAQVATAMTARRGWQRGRVGYLTTTLSELRRFANRHVEIALDGVVASHLVLLVAMANGAYYGGGMRIAPLAVPDDGWMDVCVVGDISRLTAIRQMPNLYRGTHVRHPAVKVARARSLAIEGDPATCIHLDGEPFGKLPLSVDLHPAALVVAAPPR